MLIYVAYFDSIFRQTNLPQAFFYVGWSRKQGKEAGDASHVVCSAVSVKCLNKNIYLNSSTILIYFNIDRICHYKSTKIKSPQMSPNLLPKQRFLLNVGLHR